MDYLIKTNNLSKKYGKHEVLKEVNLQVRKGCIYGFIGKNGAGKTTLIRIITGLAMPTSGALQLFGEEKKEELQKARSKMGSLIEGPALNLDMTAFENLEIIRLERGIAGRKSINQCLEIVGLNDVGNKKVSNYSLGMKQKLGIAIALMGDPELIILDEPINGLDPMGIIEVRKLLKKLNEQMGITILISSHILSELYQLANYYGIIHNGQLIEQFTQEELDMNLKEAIQVKVNDLNKAVFILESVMAIKDYKVIDEDTIKVFEQLNNVYEISKAFAENGIIIKQLMNVGGSLEEYFINLVEGK